MPASPHGWIPLASGKVRDIYVPDEAVVGEPPQEPPAAGRPRHAKPGPEALLMVTSDRISAYDYVLPTLIPGKGAVLNQLAIWWMGKLRPLVENHLLDVGAKAPAEAAQARRSQVRTVDRSERIRTYNFPENRIADHRTGFKAYNLDAVLDGDLGPVIASAIAMDEAERLSQVGEGSGS